MRICVAAIIKDENGNYLTLVHNKQKLLTLPVGKCEKDETPYSALKREMFEELDITITEAVLAYHIPVVCDEENWKLYCYYVTDYTGTIINKEPEKHLKMFYMSIEEIMKLQEPMISKSLHLLKECHMCLNDLL